MSIKINSGASNTVLRRLAAGSRGLKNLRETVLAAVRGPVFLHRPGKLRILSC